MYIIFHSIAGTKLLHVVGWRVNHLSQPAQASSSVKVYDHPRACLLASCQVSLFSLIRLNGMSSSKRKSTVHDLASLRIHPDGTRVTTSQSNKQRKKHAGQDRHGNWIAQDAGGIGRVKTRRAAAKEEEKASEEDEEEEERRLPVDEGKGKVRDEESEEDEEVRGGRRPLKDSRAKRRKTFDEDMLLLGSSLSAGPGGGEPGSSHAAVPVPQRNPLLPSSVSVRVAFETKNSHKTRSGSTQMHSSFCKHVLRRNGPVTRLQQRVPTRKEAEAFATFTEAG